MGLTPTKTTTTVLEDRSWLGDGHGHDTGISRTLDGASVRAKFPAGTFLPSGVVLAQSTATTKAVLYAGTSDEVQTVTITGAPTGGTFTLTFSGQTTAAIAFNATAAAVQTALEALSNIAVGEVVVTGGPGPATAWTVTFAGTLANTNVTAMTATSSLTGGTTPAVTVATTTEGGTDLGSAGSGIAIGHLYAGKNVPASGDIHVAVMNHGRVVVKNLPALSGLDPAARTDLPNIRYDG